jgi:hypothetical protein
MRIGTANVKIDIGRRRSETCLTNMLAASPDVVALVEWGWKRRRILGRHAKSYRFPTWRRRLRFKHPTSGHVYAYPLVGGIPAVVDASWGEVIACRKVPSSGPHGRVGGRTATELLIRRRSDGALLPFRLVHLHAHHDDPAHLAAWREGVETAATWVESWTGYSCHILGDINKNLRRIGELVSCFEGNRPFKTGPHGGTIDHVFAAQEADDVEAVPIPSDHPRGVVAVYE